MESPEHQCKTSDSSSCCGGECGHCHDTPEPDPLALSGWRLTVSSLAVFVLPLLLAIAGGLIGHALLPDVEHSGSAASVVGLLGGVVAAVAVGRMLRPTDHEEQT